MRANVSAGAKTDAQSVGAQVRRIDRHLPGRPRVGATLTDAATSAAGSRDEPPAQEEPPLADLGYRPRLVRGRSTRRQEVDDVLAARAQQLGDQPAVTSPPRRLRTQEACPRFLERAGQRSLPVRRPHASGVAPERRDADALEVVLAGLV